MVQKREKAKRRHIETESLAKINPKAVDDCLMSLKINDGEFMRKIRNTKLKDAKKRNEQKSSNMKDAVNFQPY